MNITKKESNSQTTTGASRKIRVTSIGTNTYSRPTLLTDGIRLQSEKTPKQRANDVAKSKFLNAAGPSNSAHQPFSTSRSSRMHSLYEKPATHPVPPIVNNTASRPVARTMSLPMASTIPVATSNKPPEQKNVLTRLFSFKSKELKPKPGYALIINNQTFNVKGVELLPRAGSHHDVDKLDGVFKEFNIETHVKNDLKVSQIKQKVKSLRRANFSKYGCFIIVILTHGTGNELYAKDKKYNFINVIQAKVLKNKSLLEMPKVFILQCSMNKTHVIMPPDDTMQTDSGAVRDPHLNIFKYHAFHYNHNVDAASVFVEKLSRELKSRGKYLNIKALMENVNNEVGKTDVPKVPYFESTLVCPIFSFRKLLYVE